MQEKQARELGDDEIVDLYWARNEEAIRATDLKYRAYLLRVANNILHDLEDSEECLNDTYISAWNSMPPKRPYILKAYLATIMRRCALMCYRRRNAQKRTSDSQAVTLSDFSYLSNNDIIYTDHDSDMLARVIEQYIDSLDDEQRYIFISRYYYGKPIEQIMQKLGCSRSKVNKQIARIKQELKEKLEEEGYFV